MDTDWRRRYRHRTEHPETDAEKMICELEEQFDLDTGLMGDEARAVASMVVDRLRTLLTKTAYSMLAMLDTAGASASALHQPASP